MLLRRRRERGGISSRKKRVKNAPGNFCECNREHSCRLARRQRCSARWEYLQSDNGGVSHALPCLYRFITSKQVDGLSSDLSVLYPLGKIVGQVRAKYPSYIERRRRRQKGRDSSNFHSTSFSWEKEEGTRTDAGVIRIDRPRWPRGICHCLRDSSNDSCFISASIHPTDLWPRSWMQCSRHG